MLCGTWCGNAGSGHTDSFTLYDECAGQSIFAKIVSMCILQGWHKDG